MNTPEDQKWQGLLRLGAPTFAGEAEPPYGLVTQTLARLQAQERQQEDLERIGWRALLASLAALMITATVILSVNYKDQAGDFEPGVRGVVQMDTIQVS